MRYYANRHTWLMLTVIKQKYFTMIKALAIEDNTQLLPHQNLNIDKIVNICVYSGCLFVTVILNVMEI